jgi:hypothetical protein
MSPIDDQIQSDPDIHIRDAWVLPGNAGHFPWSRVMPTVTTNQSLAWDYPTPLLVDGFRIYANGDVVFDGPDSDLVVPLNTLGLTPDTDYTMQVAAYHAGGQSDLSTSINFTLVEGPPVAPTNLRIVG